jgi:hypothetical protein
MNAIGSVSHTPNYRFNSKKVFSSQTIASKTSTSVSEMTSDFRTLELYLPFIPYTVKGGDYMPVRKRLLTPHLYSTIMSISRGERTPTAWYFDLRTLQQRYVFASL